MWSKAIALSLLLSLSACSTSTAGIRAACGYFPQPSFSKTKDTKETVFWFMGTEAYPGYAIKWDRLCAK